MNEKLNLFCDRMRYWCEEANLGYDQSNRQNFDPAAGECDCSSLVVYALKEAGFETGSASYTGNLSKNLTANGWKRIPNDGKPKKGDILLNDNSHVAVWLGDCLAQASIDENNNITGGQSGDQTGKETYLEHYYNYPWDCYLRFEESEQTEEGGKVMSLNGIDISGWQRGIDLSRVPCDFVICKATGGTGFVNPDCDRAYQQAKRLGKKLGVYHFAREKGYEGSAIQEADFFLKNIEGYIGEAILVLDWEASAVKLGPDWALQWLNRVYEKTGVKPLLYTYNNSVNTYDWSRVVAADYGLWNAGYYAYGTTFYDYNPNAPLKGGTGAWPGAAMYQYTSEGRLGYWNGNLDLDVFYGSASAWDAYARGSSAPAPEPEPEPEPQPKDGANVQLYEVNHTDAQRWWKRENPDGTISFRNVSSYKWLSVFNGANIENESNVVVWEGTTEDVAWDVDDPRPAQKFILEPAPNNPKLYNILYADNPNYAIDVASGSFENGANIWAYERNGTYAQEWFLYELPDSSYQIINAYSWKALDVLAGGY